MTKFLSGAGQRDENIVRNAKTAETQRRLQPLRGH